MKNAELLNKLADESPDLEVQVDGDLQSHMEVISVYRGPGNKVVIKAGVKH